MKPPNLPVMVALVISITVTLFTAVWLLRTGLGGMIPLLPVAAGGCIVIGRWALGLVTVREERKKSKDLDQELKDLIEGNYL